MLLVESDLSSGPSPVGDTADGNASELYVTPCSIALRLLSPSPEQTLLPLSVSRERKAAFVTGPSRRALGCGTGARVLWAQRSGAALAAGAGRPAAGPGARAAAAQGGCAVATTHSQYVRALLPGWPESQDTDPRGAARCAEPCLRDTDTTSVPAQASARPGHRRGGTKSNYTC